MPASYSDEQRALQEQFHTGKMADLLEHVIVHSEGQVGERDPLLAAYTGADLVVRIAVDRIFVNCSRYGHRYQRLASSRCVSRAHCETPFVEWKRIDLVRDALWPRDAGKTAAAGGTITEYEYEAKLAAGEA